MPTTRALRNRNRESVEVEVKPEKPRLTRKAAARGKENDENSLNKARPSKRRKFEAKVGVETDGPPTASDVEDERPNFEKLRQQNIEANAEFLSSLGVFEAKAHLGLVTANQKPTRRGLKEWKPREKVVLPRRSSLRIQNKDPDGLELPPRPVVTPLFEEDIHERKSAEPTAFVDCLRYKNVWDDAHQKFLTSLKQLTKPKKKKASNHQTDTEKFVESLEGMKIRGELVAKVVPQRIFSIAVHPRADKVLACVGDKWGRLGIWDVGSKLGQDGVFCYDPQSRPIYELRIPPHDATKIFSSSYDGTLKCGDLCAGVFSQVFATPADEYVRLYGFDFTSRDTAVVGLSGGFVSVVDFRTDGGLVSEHHVDQFAVKGISVHPTQPHYFLTAAISGTVCLFDARKLSRTNKRPKPLLELPHPKSTDGAVFSPVTGSHVVTICMDDKIRLYDSSDLTDITLRHSIPHNNHTGRWLSNFRPAWHPARDDLFVVGSMKHPRQIELYDTRGRLLRAFTDGQQHLASVCSLNAFHPTRSALVGGNSSGRVHVFMD